MQTRCFGAACVVAGTAIGAGVLVLPLVCAKVGFLSGLLLMAGSWFVAYFMALVALELNLQAGSGHTLGALGKKFSGHAARFLGDGSVKILCYVLFMAYLCGGADVAVSMCKSVGVSVYENTMKHIFAGAFIVLMACGVRYAERWNRVLFAGICVIFLAAIAVLVMAAPRSLSAPEVSIRWDAFSLRDALILPVLFTSFGFQVVFHTLTNYCKKDKDVLRKAFFWGSFVPFLFYLIWTFGALYVVAHVNREVYLQLMAGQGTLGDLMAALTGVLGQTKGWCAEMLRKVFMSGGVFLTLSLLAILTSMVGVSLGLATSWESILPKREAAPGVQRFISVLIAVVPAWGGAIFFPRFFVRFLAFAGCVLAVIAVFLPLYLLHKQRALAQNKMEPFYPIVDSYALQFLSIVWGVGIVVAEGIQLL